MNQDKGKGSKRAVFSVRNIDCATCALAIEKRLKKLEGVENVGSAIMLNKIFVDYNESKVGISAILKAIKEAGYSSYVTNDNSNDSMR